MILTRTPVYPNNQFIYSGCSEYSIDLRRNQGTAQIAKVVFAEVCGGITRLCRVIAEITVYLEYVMSVKSGIIGAREGASYSAELLWYRENDEKTFPME